MLFFRKPKGSKSSEEEPEASEDKAAEIIPEAEEGEIPEAQEVQEGVTAENIPEPKKKRFLLFFRKPKGGKAAEEEPEASEDKAAEIIPEAEEGEIPEVPGVQEGVTADNIPEPKKKRFLWFLRKPKGGKATEEEPEAPEGEAAEIIPEAGESIVPEEIPDVQESKAPEAAELKKKRFLLFFRKPRGAKAAEEKPEVPEIVAAEIIPEAEAGQKPPEEAEKILLIKKKPWTVARKIIVSVSSILVLLILTASLYKLNLDNNPIGGLIPFRTPATATSETPQTGGDEPVGPAPTIDPYEVLRSRADFSMLDGIVNILLIGVDHGDERDLESWKGKTAWHSDVMIILSINTNTNKVSLISLPRDTFAKIPGVNGIYKLNTSLNCGGGWPDEANNYSTSGFEKVCEAAEWMIGGIDVDFYYAVDFSAVKGLVDAIGGVDFNVDIAFTINGRSYQTGMQHMNGQGALDYMRVRKTQNIEDPNGETGDLHRINRQKAMLVAIFETLKRTGGISALPEILGAFEGNLYTNVPIDQTAGLAYYAYKNIDPKTIDVHSMDGKYSYKLFDYSFVITDVRKRIDIVKTVYGVDISKDKQYSEVYKMYKRWSLDRAWSLWYNMQTEVILTKSKPLLNKAKQILDEDAATPTDPPEPSPSESAEPSPSEPDSSPPPAESTEALSVVSSAGLFYRGPKYGPEVRQLYETCEAEYTALEACKENDSSDKRGALIEKYKTDVQELCRILSIGAKNWSNFWTVVYNAKSKGSCNQHVLRNDIYVDFR